MALTHRCWILALSLMLPLAAHAQWNAPEADDSDLSGARGVPATDVPLTLTPDRIETETGNEALTIQVLREDRGLLVPIEGLNLTRSGCSNSRIKATAKLTNSFFSVTQNSTPYTISVDAPCAGAVRAIFKADSNGGQALGIWQIAHKAMTRLESSVGLSFWQSQIQFVWPADADYYSWGSVHISRGDHWDVVGHEMGHAIYDQADLGQFGGGPHKIDECYSTEMAVSEGWASYFSGWISVDLTDSDAKFEYMVPRRAPIRFESIPSDVCQGEKNEWRVNGFFWDLIDLNSDNENMTEAFARIWKALERSRVSSASQALRRLEAAGLDPQLLRLIWTMNFSPE